VIGVARDSFVAPRRRDEKDDRIHVLEDEEWR